MNENRLQLPSKRGPVCTRRSFMTLTSRLWSGTSATNCRTMRAASVFPAPLSPDTTMHWSSFRSLRNLYADPAIA